MRCNGVQKCPLFLIGTEFILDEVSDFILHIFQHVLAFLDVLLTFGTVEPFLAFLQGFLTLVDRSLYLRAVDEVLYRCLGFRSTLFQCIGVHIDNVWCTQESDPFVRLIFKVLTTDMPVGLVNNSQIEDNKSIKC